MTERLHAAETPAKQENEAPRARQAYEAPVLRHLGSVRELTLALTAATGSDGTGKAFP